MFNQVTMDNARKLKGKIEDAPCPLAVFVCFGDITCTKSTTEAFSERYRKRPHHLMGIYDVNVDIKTLAEDLFYMGIK